jgi:hypothetical protein
MFGAGRSEPVAPHPQKSLPSPQYIYYIFFPSKKFTIEDSGKFRNGTPVHLQSQCPGLSICTIIFFVKKVTIEDFGKVGTGTPAHKASRAVECAEYESVSQKRSEPEECISVKRDI